MSKPYYNSYIEQAPGLFGLLEASTNAEREAAISSVGSIVSSAEDALGFVTLEGSLRHLSDEGIAQYIKGPYAGALMAVRE